jgi:hypothetical protein
MPTKDNSINIDLNEITMNLRPVGFDRYTAVNVWPREQGNTYFSCTKHNKYFLRDTAAGRRADVTNFMCQLSSNPRSSYSLKTHELSMFLRGK